MLSVCVFISVTLIGCKHKLFKGEVHVSCDACLSIANIFGLLFYAESESKPVNVLVWLWNYLYMKLI
jgi:hypothetical protein